MLTPRLEVRRPEESDRPRFVELFRDDDFMVFSAGTLTEAGADARFDRMLAVADEVAFAKQPVIERSTGLVVGYSGVDWYDFEGGRRLEYGYRMVPAARGLGYATEAGRALLEVAAREFRGELLALVDPANAPSQRVCRKLGFTLWKQAVVDGHPTDVSRLEVGSA